jgi:hypothetical protein
MRIRGPLASRFTRMFLGAVAATGLMCVLAVGNASAQTQEDFPPLPPIPAGDAPLPPIPAADTPLPPSVPPTVVQPFVTKVMGRTVRWTRPRTLSVRVSCGLSGTVAVFRHGSRIGRNTFICPATRATTVRVRINPAANRRLRVGAIVRARVISGAQRHSKFMRVVRTVRSTRVVVSAEQFRATSAYASCTPWYVATLVGGNPTWATSSAWYETVCKDSGFYGTHLADWWDYYYWTTAGYWAYYGAWIRNHADGCFRYWDPGSGQHFGPYCPQ